MCGKCFELLAFLEIKEKRMVHGLLGCYSQFGVVHEYFFHQVEGQGVSGVDNLG